MVLMVNILMSSGKTAGTTVVLMLSMVWVFVSIRACFGDDAVEGG